MHFRKKIIPDLLIFLKYFILMIFAWIFSFPGLIINTPVAVVLAYMAEKEREKANF